VDYSGASISPYTEYPGMEQPVTYWDPSIAPSGLTVYRGDAFPAWQGSLFVGALKDRDVRRLVIEDGKVVAEEALFESLGERIRDVRSGPDGDLYLLTDSSDGRIVRVSPD
jgi:glucose/arabinose dehydrogenase